MISIDSLNKSYDNHHALKDLSLQIAKGEIFGLLGINGAGKTTLISILNGISKKDAGTVLVDQFNIDQDLKKIKRISSLIPQKFAFYPTLTAYQNLEYFAAVNGYTGNTLKQRIHYAAETARLTHVLEQKATTFSGGLKRRLNLAIGLLTQPKILYLDEPTAGVDPQTRAKLLDEIRTLSTHEGMTIVYTSHYIEEVEYICDHVAILHQGNIKLCEKKEVLLGRAPTICIKVDDLSVARPMLQTIDGLEVKHNSLCIPKSDHFEACLKMVLPILLEHQVRIIDIQQVTSRLEDIFIQLSRPLKADTRINK